MLSYQIGNNSLVLYDKTPVSVATNRILAPSLTANKALATVPYSDPDMLQKVFYEGETKSGVKVDIGRKTLFP